MKDKSRRKREKLRKGGKRVVKNGEKGIKGVLLQGRQEGKERGKRLPKKGETEEKRREGKDCQRKEGRREIKRV